jgi:hypothetical protein
MRRKHAARAGDALRSLRTSLPGSKPSFATPSPPTTRSSAAATRHAATASSSSSGVSGAGRAGSGGRGAGRARASQSRSSMTRPPCHPSCVPPPARRYGDGSGTCARGRGGGGDRREVLGEPATQVQWIGSERVEEAAAAAAAALFQAAASQGRRDRASGASNAQKLHVLSCTCLHARACMLFLRACAWSLRALACEDARMRRRRS